MDDKEQGAESKVTKEQKKKEMQFRIGYTIAKTFLTGSVFYLALIMYMFMAFGEIHFDPLVDIFYTFLIAYGITIFLDSVNVVDDMDQYM